MVGGGGRDGGRRRGGGARLLDRPRPLAHRPPARPVSRGAGGRLRVRATAERCWRRRRRPPGVSWLSTGLAGRAGGRAGGRFLRFAPRNRVVAARWRVNRVRRCRRMAPTAGATLAPRWRCWRGGGGAVLAVGGGAGGRSADRRGGATERRKVARMRLSFVRDVSEMVDDVRCVLCGSPRITSDGEPSPGGVCEHSRRARLRVETIEALKWLAEVGDVDGIDVPGVVRSSLVRSARRAGLSEERRSYYGALIAGITGEEFARWRPARSRRNTTRKTSEPV